MPLARRLASSTSEDRSASKRYLRGIQSSFSYEMLDFVKRDVSECSTTASEKGHVSIKEFYNKRFIGGHLKYFIRKYNCYGDINPNSTPIVSTKANLLQKMQLNSPLRQTLRTGQPSSGMKPPQKESTPIREGGQSHLRSPMLMTPFSKQLFAADSPFHPPAEPMLKK